MDTAQVVLVVTVGPCIAVERHAIDRASDAVVLPFGWSATAAVIRLEPGHVSAALRRSEDGKRWLVETTDYRRDKPKHATFEQIEDRWDFRKVE
jgi:hypothetical protein